MKSRLQPRNPLLRLGRFGRQRGFNFTEVMFAVMILGIGFIMVAAMFPVAIQQSERNVDESMAYNVANNAFKLIQGSSTSADFTPTPTVATLPTSILTRIPGNQVFSADPRFGWVALYKQDPAPTVQLWVVTMRSRTQVQYDPVEMTGKVSAACNVDLIEGLNQPDRIVFNSSGLTPAEGMTVLIGPSQQSYTLGPNVGPNTFELRGAKVTDSRIYDPDNTPLDPSDDVTITYENYLPLIWRPGPRFIPDAAADPGPGSYTYDEFHGSYANARTADDNAGPGVGDGVRYGPGTANGQAGYQDPGTDLIVGTDDDPFGPGPDGIDGTADDMNTQYTGVPGTIFSSFGRFEPYEIPIRYDPTALPPRVYIARDTGPVTPPTPSNVGVLAAAPGAYLIVADDKDSGAMNGRILRLAEEVDRANDGDWSAWTLVPGNDFADGETMVGAPGNVSTWPRAFLIGRSTRNPLTGYNATSNPYEGPAQDISVHRFSFIPVP